MGKFKEFKTFIRKKIGMVGVGEFVDDPIAANSKTNWDSWFSNSKYLAEYAAPGRIASYVEIIRELDKHSVFENTKTVMDAGCGTGHFLSELYKVRPDLQLTGTDFSEESVKISKNLLPQADFFTLDVYNIPTDFNNKFDVIICSEVLEHLLYPEKALKNLFNLLSDGGKMTLCVPNGRIDNYSGHINFWSPESWKVFIESNVDNEKYAMDFYMFNNNRNNLAIITTR